jgi:hypothetical protein
MGRRLRAALVVLGLVVGSLATPTGALGSPGRTSGASPIHNDASIAVGADQTVASTSDTPHPALVRDPQVRPAGVPDPLSHLPAYLAATHGQDPVPALGQSHKAEAAAEAAAAALKPPSPAPSAHSDSSAPQPSVIATPTAAPTQAFRTDSTSAPKAARVVPAADPTYNISGTVTNSDGQPIENVNVGLVVDGNQGTGPQTDSNGNFTIVVAAGTYALGFFDPGAVYMEGYWTTTGWAHHRWSSFAVSGDVTDRDIVMPRIRHVTGTLVQLNGAPAAGMWVAPCDLAGNEGQGDEGSMTSAAGQYNLRVPAGQTTVKAPAVGAGVFKGGWVGPSGMVDTLGAATVFDTTSADVAVGSTLVKHIVPWVLGIVKDRGGHPMSGVGVGDEDHNFTFTTTDSQGRYDFAVRSNPTTIKFVAPDHYVSGYYDGTAYPNPNQWSLVPVSGDILINVTIRGDPIIRGRVTDIDGTGITGINVQASANGASGAANSADGYYSIAVAPNLSYTIYFYDPTGTYASVWYTPNSYSYTSEGSTTVEVGIDDVENIDVKMLTNVTVSGTVTDATDVGLSGANISALDDEGEWAASATSAVDGTFTLRLHPGDYELSVARSGYASGWFWPGGFAWDRSGAWPITVAGDPVTVNVQLPGEVHIQGVVTNKNSVGLPNIEVDFYLHNGYVGYVSTGSGGAFSMTLPPGDYSIGYDDPGSQYGSGWLGVGGFTIDFSSARTISLGSVDVTGIHVSLPPMYKLTVSSGDLCESCTVMEAFVDGIYYSSGYNDQMGFFYLPVVSGTVTLWFFDGAGRYGSGWYSTPGFSNDWHKATGIKVNNANVSITVRLAAANVIPVRVQDSVAPTYGLNDTVVTAYYAGAEVGYGDTGDTGTARLALLAGSYTLSIDATLSAPWAGTYSTGWYVGTGGHFSPAPSAATAVAAPHATVTVSVPKAGHAVGHLRDRFGFALGGIEVEAFIGGSFYSSMKTDGSGALTLPLEPGAFVIGFYDPFERYAPVWYKARGVVSDVADATALTFTAGQTIDITSILRPTGLPDAPTGLTAAAYNQRAVLAWTNPTFDGGSPITVYTVTSAPDGLTCRAAPDEAGCTVSGLDNGTAYTFTVTATSARGTSAPSDPAGPVTPAAVPEAPRNLHAVAFSDYADITWSAPASDNGYAISGYTTTLEPGHHVCTTTNEFTCTLSGLTAHTLYLVSVVATNENGDSPPLTGHITPKIGSSYVPITPNRVLDTLARVPTVSAGLVPHVPLTFAVTNRHPGDATRNVPYNAVAVTGVLSVSGSPNSGLLSLTVDPVTFPTTSTLNFPRGDSRSTGVTIPLKSDGTLSVTYDGKAGHAQAAFDVTGYFLKGTVGATYSTLSPTRILDTRLTNLSKTALTGKFLNGKVRTFAVAGSAGVPADAVAVTGTLTMTLQSSAGRVVLEPDADDNPATGTIYGPAGDNRATSVTIKLAPNGTLSAVWLGATNSSVHVLFDVTGYFEPGTEGAMYVPLTPNRILDTRASPTNGIRGWLATMSGYAFMVTNRKLGDSLRNVPPEAIAVTGILTVTQETSSGFLSLTPYKQPNKVQPPVSTLNFGRDDRATGVTAPIVTGGSLDGQLGIMYWTTKTGQRTHAVFDVSGYFVK